MNDALIDLAIKLGFTSFLMSLTYVLLDSMHMDSKRQIASIG